MTTVLDTEGCITCALFLQPLLSSPLSQGKSPRRTVMCIYPVFSHLVSVPPVALLSCSLGIILKFEDTPTKEYAETGRRSHTCTCTHLFWHNVARKYKPAVSVEERAHTLTQEEKPAAGFGRLRNSKWAFLRTLNVSLIYVVVTCVFTLGPNPHLRYNMVSLFLASKMIV